MQPGLFQQQEKKILPLEGCPWEKLGCSKYKGFVYLNIVFVCCNLYTQKNTICSHLMKRCGNGNPKC